MYGILSYWYFFSKYTKPGVSSIKEGEAAEQLKAHYGLSLHKETNHCSPLERIRDTTKPNSTNELSLPPRDRLKTRLIACIMLALFVVAPSKTTLFLSFQMDQKMRALLVANCLRSLPIKGMEDHQLTKLSLSSGRQSSLSQPLSTCHQTSPCTEQPTNKWEISSGTWSQSGQRPG